MRKSLFFYVTLLCIILCGNATAQVWEPLGDPSGVSAGNAGRQNLVVDDEDNLIVGYYDVSVIKGSVQKYNWADGNWEYVGGTPGVTPGTTTYNSLSVDSNGSIYFLYQAITPEFGHDVQKFENNAWTQLPKVTTSIVNFNASAFSEDDVLFAANNENNGTVKKFVNGEWIQVGTSGFASALPNFLDMVVGTNGKVYVSFNNNGFVHVYENSVDASSSDAWQPVGGIANLAPSPSAEDYNSSLAIDSENNLFIAYISDAAGGNKLNVKKHDGTAWFQLGNENFTAGRAKHTSIAIGANDIVYVAVSNWENENLLRNYVMAYDEGANIWSQAGVGFASEGQGIFNSLAVDSFGNLYMSYTDSGLDKLMVKTLNLNIVAAETLQITTENNVPAEINVDNGTLQLTSQVLPLQANQNVVWSISDGDTFATVDENGLVTAIASNAIVTVKAQSVENSSVFSTIQVNITNQNSDIEAESIVITTSNGESPDILQLDGTLQLIATTLPAEADQYVTWTVEEGNNIVSINEEGLVTGLAEGNALVRATHIDGELYDEIRVYVWENGCSQGNETSLFGYGFSISKFGNKGADDFVVEPGIQFELGTIRINVLSPAEIDLTFFDFTFFKNKNGDMPGEEITTIENLVPTSQKFIQDLGFGVYHYEVELNLTEPITFTQGTYWIQPIVTAADGGSVFWDSTVSGGIGGDYHIDYLDGNGWRKAAGGGFNGAFELTGNCTPMSVIISTVNGEDASVLLDESLQLEAVVNGTGNQDVNWTITNGSDLVSINENGLVTGIEVGVATIRATSVENGNYDEIEVTVVSPDACSEEVSENDKEEGIFTAGNKLAVDIDVPEGLDFIISTIKSTTVNYSTNFQFKFYNDNEGFPGEELFMVDGVIVDDVNTGSWEGTPYWGHEYTVKLTESVSLSSGKYWMEIITDAIALESSTLNTIGLPLVVDSGNGWVYSPSGSDFVYKLLGDCGDLLSTHNVKSQNQFSYNPNPVKDYLTITSEKIIESVTIYNITGQQLGIQNLNVTKGQVDMSSLASGIYMLKATMQEGHIKTFKIIKK